MAWQVASLIARCQPADRPMVEATLASVPGIEVAGAEGGTLVVLVEGLSEGQLAERFDAVRTHPKVLSAVLVEHRIDTDPPADPNDEARP